MHHMKHALVGFPYAFQIWACKVIPLLGMKYASRIDNVNDWEKYKDHEEAEAYTTAAVATMKGGNDGGSSKLPSFKELVMMFINFQEKTEANFNEIRNPRSESYNATMGNDMTMDFKSKLGKFETPGKDNKKEASMDDA
ncbi:hypothetical protein CK203_004544 [Vitis vinifera]|uniref:Uncharacterized protein n=1 Tax=Vitis vinifera TaxID=29760 RepID=A0A438KG74_VITVI|nr:hypothetical protein CK203_004544 [Vitis vinifera]